MKKLDNFVLVLAVALAAMAMLPRSCSCAAPAPALSQDRETTLEEDAHRRALLHLADTVSRVCAHEASLSSMADCYLVWQAARNHGDTASEHTAWLFRHSPCALRGIRCGHGRHQHDPGHWSSTLPLSGNEQPENWAATISWAAYAPRWAEIRRTVRHLVVQSQRPREGWPCEEQPDTWAGRVHDSEHVERNAEHLRALDCRDRLTGEPTRNEGYIWR